MGRQTAIHHITGEMCFIIEEPCDCTCHGIQPVLHIRPCCDNGIKRRYEFIKEDKHESRMDTDK